MSNTRAVYLPVGEWVEVITLRVGILTNNNLEAVFMAYGDAPPTDPNLSGHIVAANSNEKIQLEDDENLYVRCGSYSTFVDVVEWS